MTVTQHTLTTFASREVFDHLDRVGAGRITPIQEAAPGDIVGCFLLVNFLDDKNVGYNHADPIFQFLVMTEDGPERVSFPDLPEAGKDAAARLSLEMGLCWLTGCEAAKDALRAIEDEEYGAQAEFLILPNLVLVCNETWEEMVDFDRDDEDEVEAWIDRNFAAIRRETVSNHEAVSGRPAEARDLAAALSIVQIREDTTDPDEEPIRLLLPNANG